MPQPCSRWSDGTWRLVDGVLCTQDHAHGHTSPEHPILTREDFLEIGQSLNARDIAPLFAAVERIALRHRAQGWAECVTWMAHSGQADVKGWLLEAAEQHNPYIDH